MRPAPAGQTPIAQGIPALADLQLQQGYWGSFHKRQIRAFRKLWVLESSAFPPTCGNGGLTAGAICFATQNLERSHPWLSVDREPPRTGWPQ